MFRKAREKFAWSGSAFHSLDSFGKKLCGTLQAYLRAAPDHPEHIWAETQKLSAVGEKSKPPDFQALNRHLLVPQVPVVVWSRVGSRCG